jgi:predicted Kef-type K+ transport protein
MKENTKQRNTMNKLFNKNFWTAEKRSWLYKVVVAGLPLLVAIGAVTGDMAQLILNVIAAVLGVGAGGLALVNLTPDIDYSEE